jgi:hypothetical protein
MIINALCQPDMQYLKKGVRVGGLKQVSFVKGGNAVTTSKTLEIVSQPFILAQLFSPGFGSPAPKTG